MTNTNSHHPKIYFPGLNALRFFAASLVVVHHAETIRLKFNLPNLKHFSFFQNGMLAVSFFFVLSGFLITFLLISEIERTKTVSIRNFYVRRILRIWPLYYLLVIIGLFVIPTFLSIIGYDYKMPYDTTTAGVLFLFFLSFVVNTMFGSHLLEPLWSIGVEEFFYLIWAPLAKFSKHKILNALIFVFVFKTLLNIFFTQNMEYSDIPNPFGTEGPYFTFTKEIVTSLKFELMAIGGIGAWFVARKRAAVETHWLFSLPAQIVLLTVILLRLFFHNSLINNGLYIIFFNTSVVTGIVEGLLFLWLILNVSVNPKTITKLQNRWLDFLGEISYGIYMYQMLVIFASVLVLKKILIASTPFPIISGFPSSTVSHLFFYVFISFAIISISWFSKRFFEDWFLKLKGKFDFQEK
jgi:peptidoglycan/LPS O-acetylase OafA/YrhL